MHRFYAIILSLFIIGVFLPKPVGAQPGEGSGFDLLEQLDIPHETPLPETSPENTDKEKPPSEIPDAYVQESYSFFENCENTPHLKEHYDCKCLSGRYLDQRIKYQDKTNQARILQSIFEKCIDTTHAAGERYLECLGNASLIAPDMPPIKFCKCYANAYANIYKNHPEQPSARKSLAVRTQASITCSDPDLAKELYPFELQFIPKKSN